jgi:hypothetical protein
MSIDTFLLSADTTDLNYPEVRPTLDLNFARVKALDPRITFTRASGGSYVGADGLIKLAGVNEARFDHDPVTGESLGLLVEESRTNLLTYSEQFDDADWAKGNVSITANTTATTAPDGTNSADKLVENTANAQHITYKNITGSNETVTFSVFAKAGERIILAMQLSNFLTEAVLVNFNLLLGTKSTIIGGGIDYTNSSASIIPYPNGWYRCIITSTKGAAVNTVNNPSLATNNNFAGSSFYTGDGTSGIYIWGAQLEAGAFPTSYIPTVASTRTRAADNASITGKNFSEWYRQDEGSIFVNYKGKSQEGTSYERVYSINLNSTPNVEEILLVNNIGYNPDRIGYLVYDNSVAIQDTTSTTGGYVVPSSSPVKTAMSYKTASYAYVFNGGIVLNSNSGGVPTVNTLDIGRVGAGSQLNGTISQLSYFPKRLTNAQLQALTR